MKKVITIVVLSLLVLGAALGVGFFTAKNYYENQVKTVVKEVPVEKIVETEKVVSQETIESGLNEIGKLCTAEYYYTHVTQYDSAREFKGVKIPLTTSKFIYSYDGKILAGFDFTRISVTKDDRNKIINIKLPAVEIISSAVDQDSFKLYDEKNNIFNPIGVTDVTDSLADLQSSEETKAISQGLFERAEENAKSLIKNFMKSSFGVEDYNIVIELSD